MTNIDLAANPQPENVAVMSTGEQIEALQEFKKELTSEDSNENKTSYTKKREP